MPRPEISKDTCWRKTWMTCSFLLGLPLLLVLGVVVLPFYLVYKLLVRCCACCRRRTAHSDKHWDQSELPNSASRCCKIGLCGTEHSTVYVETRDGQQLAVDLYLPPAHVRKGQKIACVYHQARYCRSFALRWPLSLFFPHSNFSLVANQFGHDVVNSGHMAFVSVDIRGTGASTGRFASLWSALEREDAQTILDWIIAQEWSNGSVGLWGLSYDATAAMFTAASGHKAVKCCVCMFPFWDFYKSIAFPGGLRNKYFISTWQAVNDCLDFHRLDLMGSFLTQISFGVSPVKGCEDVIERAREQHCTNWDASADAGTVENYDDCGEYSQQFFETMCVHGVAASLRRHKVPLYLISGWADCTVMDSVAAFKAVQGNGAQHELTIGPWTHGGVQNCDFKHGTVGATFPFDRECTRFMMKHMQTESLPGPTTVRWCRPISTHPAFEEAEARGYETSANGFWASAEDWNFPASEQLFLSSEGSLDHSRKDSETSALHSGSGMDFGEESISRWQAMLEAQNFVNYDMTKSLDQNLSFQSAPFEGRREVVGCVLVDLWMSSAEHDVDVFAYLCVESKGECRYLTEGSLRASHRKGEFGVDTDAWPFPEMPYHSFRSLDREKLQPDEPSRLQFNMMPSCFELVPGDRLVLIVSSSDPRHFDPLQPPQEDMDRNESPGSPAEGEEPALEAAKEEELSLIHISEPTRPY
eukprot:TRINITY_DN38859_c0_g1_i5.p1 TRINITY_DN38859_c0_g1~~TRINITY_DN38859_c0_g1_i5.p1  ORF type:complete len:699 (-),score=103.53 TRINITY_DN38859_c0_g1_i5:65-2161(-)